MRRRERRLEAVAQVEPDAPRGWIPVNGILAMDVDWTALHGLGLPGVPVRVTRPEMLVCEPPQSRARSPRWRTEFRKASTGAR